MKPGHKVVFLPLASTYQLLQPEAKTVCLAAALRYQLGDHVDYNPVTNRYTESAAPVTKHSPILGWAADGIPVYGPYGYASLLNPASGVRRMVSGFVLRNGSFGTTNLATTGRTTLPAWASRIQTVTFRNGPAVSTACTIRCASAMNCGPAAGMAACA